MLLFLQPPQYLGFPKSLQGGRACASVVLRVPAAGRLLGRLGILKRPPKRPPAICENLARPLEGPEILERAKGTSSCSQLVD